MTASASGKAAALLPLLLIFIVATPASPAGAVTIVAAGDVMMGSDYPSPKLPPKGGRGLLAEAAPFFKQADIAMVNLEGTLLADGDPAKVSVSGKSYLFRTPPSYAFNLSNAGITFASLANNHARDFGSAGLAATKKALRKAGVSYSSKSGEVAEFTVHGVRVAVISLSFGAPPRSIVYPAKPLEEIAALAQRYDIVVLFVHAGAEGHGALHLAPRMETFLDEPRGDFVRFSHDAIDRGADLVIGSGPHVPRAMELYRGRLIAYSLGNFATYGGVSVAGESGYAPLLTVKLTDDGAFVRGTIDSFRQDRLTGPRPDPQERAFRLVKRLTREDLGGGGLAFAPSGKIAPAK